MQKEISLKLCLLASITENSEEEIENEVLISNSKSNYPPCLIQSEGKQNLLSGLGQQQMTMKKYSRR
jgi:hypothetical protein